MKKVPLYAMAHARSGDKGDASNVGVLADDDRAYAILLAHLTAEAVKDHFGDLVAGEVERYEMPNLRALNFILHDSLGDSTNNRENAVKPDAAPPHSAVRDARVLLDTLDKLFDRYGPPARDLQQDCL